MATVKQRIYDLLVKAGGGVVTTQYLRRGLRDQSGQNVAANLRQLEGERVVEHAGHGMWCLVKGARRPLDRNGHAMQRRSLRTMAGKLACISSVAINALILAPVVRI